MNFLNTWSFVFLILVIELILVLLLEIPLPTMFDVIRKEMIRFIFKMRTALWTIAIVGSLLAYQEYSSFITPNPQAPNVARTMDTVLYESNKTLRHQRNFYLSLMVTTLAIVLLGLASICNSLAEKDEQVRKLQKNAKKSEDKIGTNKKKRED
jgi:hypothetical protein